MRLLWVTTAALALAACGAHRDRGPAWPKSAGTVAVTDPAEDGGESLEPRSTNHPSAAIEISDEPVIADATPTEALPELTPPPAPTDVTPPPPTSETMEIQVEEITITPADPPTGDP